MPPNNAMHLTVNSRQVIESVRHHRMDERRAQTPVEFGPCCLCGLRIEATDVDRTVMVFAKRISRKGRS